MIKPSITFLFLSTYHVSAMFGVMIRVLFVLEINDGKEIANLLVVHLEVATCRWVLGIKVVAKNHLHPSPTQQTSRPCE